MAYGAIDLKDLEPGYDENNGYYMIVRFTFKYKFNCSLKNDSIRIYYTENPGTGSATRIDVVQSDPNVMYWKTKKGYTKVVYKIPNLYYDTDYYFRVWLYVYNSSGSKLRNSYKSRNKVLLEHTIEDVSIQPLFEIASYENVGESNESCEWVDFTDCIKLPTYDVNLEDVTEEWDDANYVKHKIIPAQKIKGKMSLIFPTMERYNQFLYLIDQSRQNNGFSDACIELRVQINNYLDEDDEMHSALQKRARRDIGNFYYKIDSNPWIKPIIGHFDKYQPLTLTIEQA